MFYTYIHYTSDGNVPFYIGKGKGNRFKALSGRNRWWSFKVKKHGFVPEILAYWKNEQEAFEHEKFLISCFTAIGFKLVNLTNGGEGCSGLVRSEESKEKVRKANTGKVFSEERKKNIADSITGRKLSDKHAKRSREILSEIREKQKVKVVCVTTGVVFPSVSEASLNSGVDTSSIVKACKGKLKKAGGMEWAYDNS